MQRLKLYLLTNWGENVAKKVLIKITSDIRRLELYPMSGVNLGKIIDITTDYLYLFTEKNYVFYRLESDRVPHVQLKIKQQVL